MTRRKEEFLSGQSLYNAISLGGVIPRALYSKIVHHLGLCTISGWASTATHEDCLLLIELVEEWDVGIS